MTQEMQIFQHEMFGSVRAIVCNDEPWFVGNDIAAALKYARPGKAILDHVDTMDKKLAPIQTDTRGVQQMAVINESGMYALIFASQLDSARKFKHWVTSEVLPSIRKHGMYATKDTLDKMISSPEFGIKLLQEIITERKAREEAEALIAVQKPKVEFAEAVAESDDCISIAELSKIISQNLPKKHKVGRTKLFKWLRDNGYLHKRGCDRNLPCQRFIEQGLFRIHKATYNMWQDDQEKIRVSHTTKVTGKGQIYFVNKYTEFIESVA